LRTRLSPEALEKMKRGETLRELLIQPNNQPVSTEEEIILFYAFKRKILETLTPPLLKKFIERFFGYLKTENSTLFGLLSEKKDLTEEIKSELDKTMMSFFKIIKEEENKTS
ncbi:MAG: hypothetical protein PHT31_07380, partial [Candidatus Omnitrophica bacterium]|nr:hypothetical protein [Candidatus Omnitrophota bacterium]